MLHNILYIAPAESFNYKSVPTKISMVHRDSSQFLHFDIPRNEKFLMGRNDPPRGYSRGLKRNYRDLCSDNRENTVGV